MLPRDFMWVEGMEPCHSAVQVKDAKSYGTVTLPQCCPGTSHGWKVWSQCHSAVQVKDAKHYHLC